VLKPNDGLYKIEPESLTINNINLVEHDKVAIPYSQGGQKLVALLKKHSKGGKDSLIPLGHNVPFDITKVCDNLLGRKTWNQFVSYRIQDTQVIGRFMQMARWLDPNESMSLFNQAKLWGISIPGVEHTSKYDTLLTVELYKKQIEVMKRMKTYAEPWSGEFDEQD
jgi:DNA polymerase III epsilon subunit-like protein